MLPNFIMAPMQLENNLDFDTGKTYYTYCVTVVGKTWAAIQIKLLYHACTSFAAMGRNCNQLNW